ncbi:Fe-S cluster assembly sulfur transfer protein SufU [Roseococcus sp. DSY-14]|uniref:Fe-S cluster assembly sulfur transfer protein SufU n=1 Tax=Roseococcus sp. DSY-14 TaxID=3369650 RepID=UPI00387B3C9A
MSDAALEGLYAAPIRDHARQPRHRARLECADATARGDNPLCGDRVEVFLALEGGRIARASFLGRGCDVSQASADLMAGALPGLDAAGARALSAQVQRMARSGEAGGVPEGLAALAAAARFPSRVKCATLPWVTLEAALDGAREASSE